MSLLDRRSIATRRVVELDDLECLLFRASDDIADLHLLRTAARRARPEAVGLEADVDTALASLVGRRLMVNVDERYSGLALPATGG
jgi:hypothetical protein